MNFEETISPLTQFLVDSAFSVKNQSLHFIEYSSKSVIITVAYNNLEHLFYTHIGLDSKHLLELTPLGIKEVFKDDSFKFQSTLTIDNLIRFLNGSGIKILSGDKRIFQDLSEFFERQSIEYTKQIVQMQNIHWADKAWLKNDYLAFIQFLDKTDKLQLPQSYLKKYKIAEDRLQRKQNSS